MPSVRYVGFDQSEDYVTAARRRFGDRAEFRVAEVASVPPFERESYDVVLAKGVLHHVTDEDARRLFRLAHDALRPGGRLITVDGCFHDRQSGIARKVTAMDRGEYVRPAGDYEQLSGAVFDRAAVDVRDDLLRIPYSLAIGVFTRAA
jgi:SAM-dependent methyltransferase